MSARVFVVRDTNSVDISAASAAMRLAVAATADDAVIAQVNKLMPMIEEDPRENLVSSFCRMVSHLHVALTSMATPRRPFGRGELVLIRREPFQLTEGTRVAVIDRFLAINSLGTELDFASGYIAAGIVPLATINEEAADNEIFRSALLDHLGSHHEALLSCAEASIDPRCLASLGQYVTTSLFAAQSFNNEDAMHLGRDVHNAISQSQPLLTIRSDHQDWDQALNSMREAIVEGRTDDAWNLLNDLTCLIADMRLNKAMSKP